MEKLQVFQVTELLQRVIKHDFLQLIIRWNAKLRNEPFSFNEALLDLLMIIDERAAPCRPTQLQHESIQIFDLDVTCGIWIKLLPDVYEVLNLVVLDWQRKVIRLLQKCINDDRNEQVYEYLGH